MGRHQRRPGIQFAIKAPRGIRRARRGQAHGLQAEGTLRRAQAGAHGVRVPEALPAIVGDRRQPGAAARLCRNKRNG